MRRTTVVAVTLVLALLAPGAAQADPGQPDTFFGHDGIQTAFPNGAVAYAVAIDHHDRIVVAGFTLAAHADIALARFTPGGRLDPTFGQGGKVVTDLGANDYAFDVAIQDDGGIVVVGERGTAASDRFVVQRYRPNGTLDPGFANAGTALTWFGRRFQSASAVAITPGGRIVVAGSTSNGTTSRSAVARYLSDGRLDRGFGDDGRVTTDVSRSGEQFTDLTVQPDGRIVAAGWAEGSLVPVFSAVRYTTNGRLDPSFGGDGITRVDVAPGADRANAITRQDDGKFVLVGGVSAGGRAEWGLIRLGPRGHLDPTFGKHGRLMTDFGPGFDEADAIAIQDNGRLLVAGRIREGNEDDIGVLRLKPGGGHDRTFGAGGRVLTDVAGGSAAARDLVIASNGKIVLTGEATVERIRRFVVARYLSS
ncbi:MAG: delta-60 repeat domain-containing protein [Actinomycetota bacterium]